MSESPKMTQEWRDASVKLASTGVSSEIEAGRVFAYLGVMLDAMSSLSGEAEFWTRLGPSYRVMFEDLRCCLAALRVAYRE